MPVYEYECPICKGKISVTRGMLDPEQKHKCYNCWEDMIRVYDSPAVSFNGSGFYSNEKKAK